MCMSEITNLYVLIFPKKQIIKIGKANDIQSRIDVLRRWWGEVDYVSSYHLAIEEKLVYKLEKSLHFLLSSHSAEFEEGDGKTEIFAISALDHVIQFINLYLSTNKIENQLVKGIPVPIKAIAKKQPPLKYERMAKRSGEFFVSLLINIEKFRKIHRLINFLMHHQGRIQFQYDEIGGYIYFRVRHSRPLNSGLSHAVMRRFNFNVQDFQGWVGMNCCSAVGLNDVVQYKIQLIKIKDGRFTHSFLSYLSSQTEKLFSQLPKRSLATTEEIPLLDEEKIWMGIEEELSDA